MTYEKEVVRLFLNGATLNGILRTVKQVSKADVLRILASNAATKDTLADYSDKLKSGKSVLFFDSSKPGRPNVSDRKKRKIRQIRISDEEMDLLGNPTTTQMRTLLLEAKRIRNFLNYIDELNVSLFPNDLLHSEYDPAEDFWKSAYKSNYWVLKQLSDKPGLWDQVGKRQI